MGEQTVVKPRPPVVPVTWFVITVAGGAGITLFQEIVGISFPVQDLAIAILMCLCILAVIGGAGPKLGEASVALLVFFSALSITLFAALWRNADWSAVASSYVFMYGIAGFLVLHLFVPLTVSKTKSFLVFALLAVAFGLAQVSSQDLLLPSGFRASFGTVWDEFVNGRVRSTSFFASPPRFAEFIVFLLAYVQYEMMSRYRSIWLLIPAYAIGLILLYNTYSRSGYVLFLLVSLTEVILVWHQRRSAESQLARARLALAVFFCFFFMLLAAFSGVFRDSNLTDGTSLVARKSHWTSLIDGVTSGGWIDTLLGTAKSAQFSFFSENYFVVDNLVLSIYLHSGIIGLLGASVLYVATLRSAIRHRSEFGYRRWDPFISFLVAILIEGVFVDNHNTFFLLIFSALGMMTFDRTSIPSCVGRIDHGRECETR